MRALTPIILILLSGLLLIGYVDPTYAKIRDLAEQQAEFDDALDRSKELINVRDELISRRNTFTENDRRRLDVMLPNNVDNVRLIMDIDSIAARYGMSIQGVSVSEAGTRSDEGIGPDGSAIGSIELRFSVSTEYEDFIAFLEDLERSLRLVDVHSISFTSGVADFNNYAVGIRTYWLR